VNRVRNIPGVTVPDTEALTVFDDRVIVFPDDKLPLPTIKLGFIVYADVVYRVLPVKKPLGAAEL
jgi:hypothetical protein